MYNFSIISFNSQKWGIIWGTRNKKRLADICKGVLNVDEISLLPLPR